MRLTLAGSGSARHVVRRSTFIALAAPVADAGMLNDWLAALRALHPDARHCPYAWLAPDGASKVSDDGEPSGTGGRPCLGALVRAGVTGASVAVARMFGGVLLGAGNLGRAYGVAAAEAVAAAGTVHLYRWSQVHVEVGYEGLAAVERALERVGAQDVERHYGAHATLRARVPVAAWSALGPAVSQARWKCEGETWGRGPGNRGAGCPRQ